MGNIEDLVETSDNLSEIKRGLAAAVPCDRPEAKRELETKSFSDLLAIYVAWVDRLIEPRKRQVIVGDGFWNERARSRISEIAAIASLSEAGGDLTAYLSPQVHAPNKRTRSGIIDGGKDRALNAYGVHHLHYVAANARGKRSGGSKELLFVRVKRTRMHLIMAGDHGSFNDGSLRQAVADFEVASGNHIRGIVGVTNEVSAAEGEALLRRGINTVAKAEGRFAVPGLLSAAMTSPEHRQHADQIVEAIEEWEPLLRTAEGRMQICEDFNLTYKPDTAFGWAIKYSTLYLVEKASSREVFQVQLLR
ncbi:hypothetical protein [Shinella sp.]|uniref:hypothetical protein n=1 Tax=Shinella sp. TaxID=1870904 RepID=UPI003F72E0D1